MEIKNIPRLYELDAHRKELSQIVGALNKEGERPQVYISTWCDRHERELPVNCAIALRAMLVEELQKVEHEIQKL